jgi:alpha/beta superfamily hydrolase
LEPSPDREVTQFRPPAPQPAVIPGPLGGIEARIENPLAEGVQPGVVGVVCHPHPLHGGTMQNKVVHTVARAMQEAGAPTVRFNFRGVGQSAGVYADGIGEVDDALAVIAWARAHWQCERLWLGGFSFGAAVALHAAASAAPHKLVTVAPPVGRLITQPVARPRCAWLIVQGDRDELVDFEAVQRWAAGYAPDAPQLLLMNDAEHFFHGRLGELRSGVLGFLASGA